MGKVQVKQAHKAFPQFQTDFFCLFILLTIDLFYCTLPAANPVEWSYKGYSQPIICKFNDYNSI